MRCERCSMWTNTSTLAGEPSSASGYTQAPSRSPEHLGPLSLDTHSTGTNLESHNDGLLGWQSSLGGTIFTTLLPSSVPQPGLVGTSFCPSPERADTGTRHGAHAEETVSRWGIPCSLH